MNETVQAGHEHTRRHTRARLSRHAVRVAAAACAVALMVGACQGGPSGSGSTGNDSANKSSTLNVGHIIPPNSLDPAKINQSAGWFVNTAYDPLIYWKADGSLAPRLAVSWKYLNSDNTLFEFKLRPKVTFSDGAPLTAAGVKSSLEYFQKAGGGGASLIAAFKTIEAVDDLTVRIHLSRPHPQVPKLLTQHVGPGNVISPKALASPGKLATQTFGTGPYVLDTSATVANDHYTYTPNPAYWNPGDVHYKKVVIKVLPNPNTALAALKTKQVDVIHGDYTTADEAKAAGLQVAWTPLNFIGLAFADRIGRLAKPLGDVRVRQALNYAVDRKKITSGLYGEYAIPTEQIQLPDQDGYNSSNFYTYHPEKAKQLLADAGYADGFTLPVIANQYQSAHLVMQAIADDLKKVGVTLKLTVESDVNSWVEKMTSGKWPTYGILFGSLNVHVMGTILFLPEAAAFNPLKTTDAELQKLYDAAATAGDDERAKLDERIVRRLVEQAWFLPVVHAPKMFFASPDVAGVEASPALPIANLLDWRPAS